MVRCIGKTIAGNRCKSHALEGKSYCDTHWKRPRPTTLTNPLEIFRAGMHDPKSPISKIDRYIIDKIIAPIDEANKKKMALYAKLAINHKEHKDLEDNWSRGNISEQQYRREAYQKFLPEEVRIIKELDLPENVRGVHVPIMIARDLGLKPYSPTIWGDIYDELQRLKYIN